MADKESVKMWIEISPDGKTAWLNNQAGTVLAKEALLRDLTAAGVVKGINYDNLGKACQGIKLSRSEHIAEYIPPAVGEDARLKYLIAHEVKAQLREDGTINFREIDLIRNVKAGEPLARKVPFTIGAPGYYVTGKEIPGKKGADLSLKRYAGEGTAISTEDSDLIIAARPGAYKMISGGGIKVLDLYEVKGSVDYSTGNIHSTSSIIIDGDVQAGFSIDSAGDVLVKGLIENATITVEGDLNVKLGITQGFAPINVGGSLNAKYIYNRPSVRAGEVNIGEMISNSKLTVEGSVAAKRIVGGEIIAKGDILVEDAGSERHGTKTILIAGLDVKKKEKRNVLLILLEEKEKLYRDLNKKHDELSRWALNFQKQAQEREEEFTSLDKSRFGKQIKETIQNKLQTLTEYRTTLDELHQFIESTRSEIAKLTTELANPQATVTISGTVFADVSVVIGESRPMDTAKSLKKIIFMLDKEGNIVLNSLK